MANIAAAMKGLYSAKNLQIDVNVDLRCVVLCDPIHRNEMLANLIDNACKGTARKIIIRGFLEEIKFEIVVSIERTMDLVASSGRA